MVETEIENLGRQPMPVQFGFHPYFQVADKDKAATHVQITAESAFDNTRGGDEPWNGILDFTAAEVDLLGRAGEVDAALVGEDGVDRGGAGDAEALVPAGLAGAVEAASSTGGQITPPVLGAAAFLMIEFLNVPYQTIIAAAVVPAFMHFFGVFMQVHFEAKRYGLRGLTEEEMPKLRQSLRDRI